MAGHASTATAALHRQLQQWVYADQTPVDLLMPAVWGALGTFAAGLLIAVRLRSRAARQM